jgi:NAD(P)-dependent dehydrogenase (short-subunit alcohol dehydrogenase family)
MPLMNRLQGSTIVMFGGAGGIGSATSLRLASEGANVVVGSLHQENADAVAARITEAGGSALSVGVDIADVASIAEAVDKAIAAYGGIDGAHVNAANMAMDVIGNDSDAASIDLDVFDQSVRTNLRGYLACTQRIIPALLDRGGGAIVYTSSAAAFVGEPERPAYAITKAGLNSLVWHVASKWGQQGIRANAVAPGPTLSEAAEAHLPDEYKTMMLATVRSPRLGRPADIAAMVALLLSSEGEWINGQVISVDGGRTLR